jgi:hypothetical protein
MRTIPHQKIGAHNPFISEFFLIWNSAFSLLFFLLSSRLSNERTPCDGVRIRFITDRWSDGQPENNEGIWGGFDLFDVAGRHG